MARLDGETLPAEPAQAATLLATLLGQDLEADDDGIFRIARQVAPERIISAVDADARHGDKTWARSFDGYKGHIAVDPDSEVVTAVAVTPGNGGDAAVAPELLTADLPVVDAATDEPDASEPQTDEPLTVYADAAYGSGELLETLETAVTELRIKVQPPVAQGSRFSKDDFSIDTKAASVTCPAGVTAPLRTRRHGSVATFGAVCAACPLAARFTTSKAGRSISVGPHEAALARAREARHDPAWRADLLVHHGQVDGRHPVDAPLVSAGPPPPLLAVRRPA